MPQQCGKKKKKNEASSKNPQQSNIVSVGKGKHVKAESGIDIFTKDHKVNIQGSGGWVNKKRSSFVCETIVNTTKMRQRRNREYKALSVQPMK
jgi:hypothetical protein